MYFNVIFTRQVISMACDISGAVITIILVTLNTLVRFILIFTRCPLSTYILSPNKDANTQCCCFYIVFAS